MLSIRSHICFVDLLQQTVLRTRDDRHIQQQAEESDTFSRSTRA